jgi:hypothetical protein
LRHLLLIKAYPAFPAREPTNRAIFRMGRQFLSIGRSKTLIWVKADVGAIA